MTFLKLNNVFISANVIPRELVFFDTAKSRFMRPCDVPGFEALSVNCSKDSYGANKKNQTANIRVVCMLRSLNGTLTLLKLC